jgi:NAD dependent epimerase/dehydratase
MKVLVTGADGFIGSHVVEELATHGIAVKAMAQYNSYGTHGWLDQVSDAYDAPIEKVLGDIRDLEGLIHIAGGCDYIVHLAALIAIPHSYSHPRSYIETNAIGTLNVLEAARQLNVRKLVHTSTSEVYGTARFVPMTEEHPLQAQSPYAASKVASDQLVMSYASSFGVQATIVRPFNAYGPRQSARAFIPTVLSQLMHGSGEVRVGNVSPTRDFTFVSDTARAFRLALFKSPGEGEVINIGSGFEVSMKNVIDRCIDLTGRKGRVVTDLGRTRPDASEVNRLLSDSSRAKQLLGWTPEYGNSEGFTRGLMRTIEWFKAHPEAVAYGAKAYIT